MTHVSSHGRSVCYLVSLFDRFFLVYSSSVFFSLSAMTTMDGHDDIGPGCSSSTSPTRRLEQGQDDSAASGVIMG